MTIESKIYYLANKVLVRFGVYYFQMFVSKLIETDIELCVYINDKMRMTNWVRATVHPPVCATGNLSKNKNILVKLGTRIFWYYKRVNIVDVRKQTISTPENVIKQKHIKCYN